MPVEHASTKNNTPPTTDELKFGYFQAFDVSGGCLFEDHYQTIVFVPHYMAFSVEVRSLGPAYPQLPIAQPVARNCDYKTTN